MRFFRQSAARSDRSPRIRLQPVRLRRQPASASAPSLLLLKNLSPRLQSAQREPRVRLGRVELFDDLVKLGQGIINVAHAGQQVRDCDPRPEPSLHVILRGQRDRLADSSLSLRPWPQLFLDFCEVRAAFAFSAP